MAKGKPHSDSEIRPETPEILRYLESQHYRSPEWSRSVIKDKDRGLGNVDVQAQYAEDVKQIDQIPNPDGRKR